MDKQTTKQVRSKEFLKLEDRARALLIKVEEAMRETLKLEEDIKSLNKKENRELSNLLNSRLSELEKQFDNNFK